MADLIRHSGKTTQVYANCEIPEELSAISKGAVNIFIKLYDYVKTKNLEVAETLSIFDANGSGAISLEEFYDVLNELVDDKDITLDDKTAFFEFVDRNNNGVIEIAEFNHLFKLFGNYSLDELMPNEHPRGDIFTIVEKCYQNGIDLERELQSFDEYDEGFIHPNSFRFLMKKLPFGLNDLEVEKFLQDDVDFTNNGDVNYMNLISQERFKRTKHVYEIKSKVAQSREAASTIEYKTIDDLERMSRRANDSSTRAGAELALESGGNYTGMQKMIIENILYINSIEVIVYTTVNPKTSDVFVSTINNKGGEAEQGTKSSNSSLLEQFECTLVARLTGHSPSTDPPTILYVPCSGCLIAGTKIPPKKIDLS